MERQTSPPVAVPALPDGSGPAGMPAPRRPSRTGGEPPGSVPAAARRTPGKATEDLLGATRASLLVALHGQGRTTTQLASEQHLSAPAVSYHLQVLVRAGLARSVREGGAVRYWRTVIGDGLIEAAEAASDPA